MTWHVVEAAAGTGKTVELAKTYLKHLKEGLPVERIVAITFTRKAAAELIERVSDVLYALLQDGTPQSREARTKLGAELDAYDVGGWTDENAIRRALAELGAAPVGTTDSFVQKLLAEFALDARLPVGVGTAIPLDFPLAAGGNPSEALKEAARALIASPDRDTRMHVEPLLVHYTQAKLLELVTRPHPLDDLGAATIRAVFDALAQQLVTKLAVTDLRGVLRDELGLVPDPSLWEALAREKVNKAGHDAVPEVVAWLHTGDDGAVPEVFIDFFGALKSDEIARAGAPDNSGAEVAAFIERTTGEPAATWIVRELALGPDRAAGLASQIKADKPGAEADIARWLAEGGEAPPSLSIFRSMLKPVKANAAVRARLDSYRDSAAAICRRIRERTGAASACEWLRVTLGMEVPCSEWTDVIKNGTNKDGHEAIGRVAAWLAAPEETDAPGELIPVLLNQRPATQKRLFRRLLGWPTPATPEEVAAEGDPIRRLAFDLRVEGSWVHVPLARVQKLNGIFFRRQVMAEADAVRGHIEALRADVTRRGLSLAAAEGALDYEQLLDAATWLCRSASGGGEPKALWGRFDALLVDEVQDSSPAQVALYEALAATNPAMRCFFVGDSRQSIYLFRGAAPSGMAQLAERGRGPSLRTNYRSSQSLVRAQRALFGDRLRDEMRGAFLEPLDALDGLQPFGGNPDGLASPVTLVLPGTKDGNVVELKRDQIDVLALEAFATRMKERWDLGEAQCTASVLAPTWALATAACAFLRGKLGRAAAFLDGGGGWVVGRVVRDLKMLLAAFLDRGDQLAWLGVWKHPMVGLSDRALALVRNGGGLLGSDGAEAPEWQRHLGWMLEAEALDPRTHEPGDVEAFARARPALRRAAGSGGSRGAAEAIEALAVDLRWRELLATSPRDDDLAHLEVALDWLRDLGESGTSLTDILDRLSGAASGSDAPRIELHRPPNHISCTTVHQAKGLKWPHVCLMSPGIRPMGGPGIDTLTVDIGGRALRLEPVRIDPDGAFKDKADPTRRVLAAVQSQREEAECLRFAYVGVTRAKASVIMGLPNPAGAGVQRVLVAAWAVRSPEGDGTVTPIPGIEILYATAPARFEDPARGWVEPRPDAQLTRPTDAQRRRGWLRQAPSRVQTAVADPGTLARDIATRILATGALSEGGGTSLPTPPAQRWENVTADAWGTLVHSWFARWRFQGPPSRADLAAWLAEEWHDSHPDLVDWLAALSDRVRQDAESPLWQLVTHPEAQLHFELPIVGIMGFDEDQDSLLLSGRADLLVRSPGRPPAERWTVIDFKAGSKHPTKSDGVDELVTNASLKTYGPQLEAYRRMLNRAFDASEAWKGERVGDVALWFVRAGVSVVWRSAGE